MKKFFIYSVCIATLSITSYAGKYTKTANCKKDSSSIDSYSIVETEKYLRGRHNWMKVGDTLDTDIVTGGVGTEKRRNLPREAYIFPSSSSNYVSSKHNIDNYKRYEDQHPRVVKYGCDTPQECKN